MGRGVAVERDAQRRPSEASALFDSAQMIFSRDEELLF